MAIPIHRWMLHQQLWSVFLGLHRVRLSHYDSHASCQLLAQNIIGTQAQIQARCTVCGSLSSGDMQLFNAATVLLIDLLASTKPKITDPPNTQLSRLMTRDKIREAIELLRTQHDTEPSSPAMHSVPGLTNANAQRSAAVLEALMKLEEEECGSNEEDNGAHATARNSGDDIKYNPCERKSLKYKVTNILKAFQEDTMEYRLSDSIAVSNTHMSLSDTADKFPELNVLPMVPNEPDYNFWEYLDPAFFISSEENVPLPATGDSTLFS